MRLGFLFFLWLCVAAFSQEDAAVASSTGSAFRDTVFIKQIYRDTVYIQPAPIIDTIYVNDSKRIPNNSPETRDSSMAITSNEQAAVSRYIPKNDSSLHKNSFILQVDAISLLVSTLDHPAVDIALEIPFTLKHSLLLGFAYAKKYPDSTGYSDTFNSIYSGDISQITFGFAYRYCFRPTAATKFIEFGTHYVQRKSNYDNSWDNTNYINDRPHSEHKIHHGAQAFAHFGLLRRGDRMGLALLGGLAYNYVPTFNDEILKGHGFYITRGIQLDTKINVSVGIL